MYNSFFKNLSICVAAIANRTGSTVIGAVLSGLAETAGSVMQAIRYAPPQTLFLIAVCSMLPEGRVFGASVLGSMFAHGATRGGRAGFKGVTAGIDKAGEIFSSFNLR